MSHEVCVTFKHETTHELYSHCHSNIFVEYETINSIWRGTQTRQPRQTTGSLIKLKT